MNDIIKILIDFITEMVKHKIKIRIRIYSSFNSTFLRFISTTSDFFISKRYKWKMSYMSQKKIRG